jgi:hypothetical protein
MVIRRAYRQITIVAHFAQEYPRETATEVGGPLPRFRRAQFTATTVCTALS